MSKNKQAKAKPSDLKHTREDSSAGLGAVGRQIRSRASWDIIVLAVLLLIGAGVRLAYLQEIRTQPDFDLPVMDAAYKDAWAKSILTGEWQTSEIADPELESSPYLRPPGYPFVLALLYLITGQNYLLVHLFQFALGLANVVLAFFLARNVFGPLAAVVTAAGMATYWAFVFFEGDLNAPVFVIFLLLLLMHAAWRWRAQLTWKRALAGGAVVGLLALFRSETLLFAPVLFFWAVYVTWQQRPRWRTACHLLLIPAASVAVIAPVTIRNYAASGEFVPIATIGGLNFYAGNNPGATGDFPVLDYRELFGISQTLSHNNFKQLLQAHRRNAEDPTLGHADLERFFISQALAFIQDNPARFAELLGIKALLYWGPAEVSSNHILELDRRESMLLSWLPRWQQVMALFALGLIIFLVDLLHRGGHKHLSPAAREMAILFLLFILVSFATHLLFFVVGRFRVPVVPFMLIFAGYAVARVVSMLRSQQWLATVACVAILPGLAVLSHTNFAGYEPDEVRWRFMRGIAYGYAGDIDQAIYELKEGEWYGIQNDAEEPWLYSELGFAHAARNEYDDAVMWYRKALELDPGDAQTRNRCGFALTRLGRFEEAADMFRLALASDFTLVAARVNLAVVLLELGRASEAEDAFHAVLELDPDNDIALGHLGQLKSAAGQPAEAAEYFRQAVEHSPENAVLWNNLGFELAKLNEMDEAEEAYRRALDEAPGYPEALVNLANLLADRGQYETAILHYADALTLQPMYAPAEYGWGFVNHQQGKPEEAMERFRRAIIKNPEYPQAYNYLGYLQSEAGNLDAARENLERAVQLMPNFIRARNNLGDVYLKLGLRQLAREQFQQVLGLDENNKFAKDRLRGLSYGDDLEEELIQGGERMIVIKRPNQ